MTSQNLGENTLSADRLRVMLALAAQDSQEKGQCPSDEDMAAFIDGKLSSQQREAIFRHLNHCPDCYQDWLETASLEKHGWKDLLIRIKITLSLWAGHLKIPQPLRMPGFALAFASLILIFWWAAKPTELDRMLDKSCQIASSLHISPDRDSFPWEKTDSTFAFALAEKYSPPAQAFGAGLWDGKQQLSASSQRKPLPDFLLPKEGKKDWQGTQWAVYYHTGRWSSLLQAVCAEDAEEMPDDFWKEQQMIIDRLEKGIRAGSEEEREAGFVKKGLSRISEILKKTPENPDRRMRYDMARESSLLTEQMIP